MSELVESYVANRKGYIVLNRPEKRNALSPELVTQMQDRLELHLENTDVKVIILKSNGSFCAGADLSYIRELQHNSFEENLEDSNHLKRLFLEIYSSQKPVIAQVHGHAIAGGCGLVAICDFSITADSTVLGFSEVRIGFIPAIVSVFLLRKIGEGRTKELLLSGELYTAEKMREYGLVNQVVPESELESSVEKYADSLIRKNSSASMAMTKGLLEKVSDLPLGEALDLAAKQNAAARATDDCKKGLEAFLSKQKLEW